MKLIVAEDKPANVGQTFTFDRNKKPEKFGYLRNAEKYDKWKVE